MTPNNPYINAKSEWLEVNGSYIEQAKQWRLIALVSVLVSLVAVIALGVLAQQNKIVPYVVAVDTLGSDLAVGRADVAAQADSRVIRSVIARWVRNTRTVYLDPPAQRAMIDQAYYYIGSRSDAYNQLNSWYRNNNPLSQTSAKQVQITSVLALSNNSWQIEWLEIVNTGVGQSSVQWQATITILLSPPTEESIAINNPLGVYITYFDWGARL